MRWMKELNSLKYQQFLKDSDTCFISLKSNAYLISYKDNRLFNSAKQAIAYDPSSEERTYEVEDTPSSFSEHTTRKVRGAFLKKGHPST
ncbi:hypothetical protein CDAR_78921 [Caerostris darwini]|uniref:Uncharacterized protein n=1 Tax=Caerostris darwini TaxID=1538125 RepID=A0AAV4Q0F0_9ARAC|nr:hypothetical protein CDAR_78921 [Caerostris darwini]